MSRVFYSGTKDQTIRRLLDELYMARRAVVDLMPANVRSILRSYHQCKSREESHGWDFQTAKAIVDLAQPLEPTPSYNGTRAYCPLCRDGSSSPYDRGFALPEGMTMHLLGQKSAHQCSVMKSALDLARDYFHDQFGQNEEAEREEQHIQKERRRKTELLYLIRPDGSPELYDEHSSVFWPTRSKEELQWAEKRLADLNFEIELNKNVRQYKLKVGDHTVFADPRQRGSITFYVYKNPPPKRRSHAPDLTSRFFSLQDRLKNDLAGKFAARLVISKK